MRTVNQLAEFMFLLVLVYLVVGNALGFSLVISSIGGLVTGSLRTLQGR